jgi:selenocysteine lyase/cysteine desulfurase
LVSFAVEGVPASKVKTLLASEGVQVASNGEAFTPLDMRARGLGDIVRASPHIYTTDEDIACLIQAVRRVAV